MIEILANRTYRHLFAARSSRWSAPAVTVALGLLAFELAGDNAGAVLGTALAIKMIAYVGVAPIVGRPSPIACRAAPSWSRSIWSARAWRWSCPS